MPAEYTPRTPTDFRNFLYLVWKFLRLPEPTELQYDIAYYLQHGPRRCVIEAFRGEGKSWITAAFVCWLLDHHPDWNILVVSASKARADDFSTFTLRLIHEMPELQHLIPGDEQRNSKISFDVAQAPPSHAPSVKSLGITSQLTGSRADVIIPDDIEVPNNSQTQAMRDKLSEQVKEFDSIVKPGGRIVFLGTPQHEQSIYNKLPERGYQVRVWPARYPNEKQARAYGGRLAPSIRTKLEQAADAIVGKPTDPKRFDDLDLAEREASYGKAGFALQFMLDTTMSDLDRYPLKVCDLTVMSCDLTHGPEKVVWANAPDLILNDLPNVAMTGDRFFRPMSLVGSLIPYTGTVMAIDPAGRGKDELAYAVVRQLNGQLFLVKSGGLRGYGDDALKRLAEIAKECAVTWIRIEANFGDGMFEALLKPWLNKIYPCTTEEVRHSKQKELRIIDTLEPVMAQHRLIIDAKVIEDDYNSVDAAATEGAHAYRLIYQLTRVTRDRGALAHDDRLDALAMAVAYWVEIMAQDVDDEIQAEKERKLDEELDRFLDHVQGFNTRRSGWMGRPQEGFHNQDGEDRRQSITISSK